MCNGSVTVMIAPELTIGKRQQGRRRVKFRREPFVMRQVDDALSRIRQ
jgi:hypothetical protein